MSHLFAESAVEEAALAWRASGYPALRVVLRPHPAAAAEAVNVPGNVPVNVPVNDRQRWILDQLGNGNPVKARDIAEHFQVAEKTARRDIADLQAKQLIEFAGARKTGGYRIREKP